MRRLTVAVLVVCLAMLSSISVFAQTTVGTAHTVTTATTNTTNTSVTNIITTSVDTTVPSTTVQTTTPTTLVTRPPAAAILPAGMQWNSKDGKQKWETGYNGGQALHFNGISDYATLNIENYTAPLTVMAWVKSQTASGTMAIEDQRIFCLQKNGAENYIALSPMFCNTQTNDLQSTAVRFFAACKKNDWLRDHQFFPTNATLAAALFPDDWHHIALVIQDTVATIYIDGMMWGNRQLSFNYADLGITTLYIGAGIEGTNRFSGYMQDIQFHHEALTALEIYRLSRNVDPSDELSIPVLPTPNTPDNVQDTEINNSEQIQQAQTDENGTIMVSTPQQAIWEKPVLEAGQTVSGTLTLRNKSKQLVDMSLQNIVLPMKDSAQWQYLSEIHVRITRGANVLFNAPYTDITPQALRMQFESMYYGQEEVYTVSLFRSAEATTPAMDITVPWQFVCTPTPMHENALKGSAQSIGLLVLLVLSTILLGFSVYWATVRRPRRIFTVWDDCATFANKKILPVVRKVTVPIGKKIHKWYTAVGAHLSNLNRPQEDNTKDNQTEDTE